MIAWIRSYLGASKKLLAQVLVLGVIAVVFAIGLMFVAGYLIAASADNAFSLLMLNIPLAFVQIFGLGKPLARYLERLRSHDWVLRLTSTLRLRLFSNTSSANRRTGERETCSVRSQAISNTSRICSYAAFFRCSSHGSLESCSLQWQASCRQACCCSRSARSFCCALSFPLLPLCSIVRASSETTARVLLCMQR